MKKPKLSLSKESIVDFFLNHGEKFVVGLFAALACGLVWGGIDAVRTKPAKPEQRPKVIVEQADKAMKHIGESKGPPADTTKRPSLAKQVEPWKEKVVTAAPVATIFNAPLSDEKVKRTAPEVYALADLRVHPGWAVIAVPQAAMDMAALQEQQTKEGDQKGKKGKKQEAGTGPLTKGKNKFQQGGPGMPGMSSMMGGMPGMPGMPGMSTVPNGKLVPYCLVTALVPAMKQEKAFMKATNNFQFGANDYPAWSDYRVERAEIDPSAAAGAELKWSRIDLEKVAKTAEEWVGTQPFELAPQDLLLDATQVRAMDETKSLPMPYTLPLPMLAGDPWGFESLHPWVVEQMRKRQMQTEKLEALMQAEAEKAGKTNILGGGAGGPGGMGGPGMMPPGMMPGRGMSMPPMGGPGGGRGMMPPMGGPPGGGPGGEGGGGTLGGSSGRDSDGSPAAGPGTMMTGRPGMGGPGGMMMGPPGMGGPGGMMMGPPGMGGPGGMMGMMAGGPGMGGMTGMELPEYRMFRFVDTTVEPGKTYRYRVRVSVRNPNYQLGGEELSEPELAKPTVLAAPWSDPSPVAQVPDKHTFLVRSLKKGEARKTKTGYEVLVLAENPATGNYTMRSLVTELGGLVNFDKRQAKGPEAKNAETVTTNSLLVDARGRQEESEGKKGATAGPSEPLELLFLREDGSFTVATAAESKRDFDRYASTLPSADDGKKEKDAEGGGSKLFGAGGPGGPGGLFGSGPPGGAGGPPAGGPGGRASTPPGSPAGPGGFPGGAGR